MTKFQPADWGVQPTNHNSRGVVYGKNKADKRLVNKLLRDKGPLSYDWRVPLSVLEKYPRSKDIDTPTLQPKGLFSQATSHDQDIDGNYENSGPVRQVISTSRNYRSFHVAQKISPFDVSSEATLTAYVCGLVESQRFQAKIPWTAKPRLMGWTNIADVLSALNDVFYGAVMQKFLSVKAFNVALKFFYDHGMMSEARSLYIRMEVLRMSSGETFNILLRGAASQKDLYSFTFLLHKMIQRGFAPNQETWTSLLTAIDSDAARALIVQKMSDRNLLQDKTTRRNVANRMTHHELLDYLKNNRDPKQFLECMNHKYGIGWLSTAAGNQILDGVGKLISTTESLGLLYILKQNGFMPNDISIITLLKHCLPLRQQALAIEILKVFENQFQLHPTQMAYERLFLLAWRSRLLNSCVVIWRSACIYGAVSFKMKTLVFRSLLSYASAEDEPTRDADEEKLHNLSRTAKFHKWAGRFVIGVGPATYNEFGKTFKNSILESRARAVKWAQVLMESSRRVARTCRLRYGLPRLLNHALTMDKKWAAEGLWQMNDWEEMLQRAIQVHVKAPKTADPRRKPDVLRRRRQMTRRDDATRLPSQNRRVVTDQRRKFTSQLRARMPIRTRRESRRHQHVNTQPL